MIPITINVIGQKRYKRNWTRFGAVISDWRPYWGRVTWWWYKHVRAQFESEGSHMPRTGRSALQSAYASKDPKRRWVKLNEKYEKRKKLKYPGRPMLVAKGAMKGAALGRSGSFTDEGPLRIQVGTRGIAYARIHMLGGFAGRNHAAFIPPRPYAVIPPKGHTAEIELDQMMGNYIKRMTQETLGAK